MDNNMGCQSWWLFLNPIDFLSISRQNLVIENGLKIGLVGNNAEEPIFFMMVCEIA